MQKKWTPGERRVRRGFNSTRDPSAPKGLRTSWDRVGLYQGEPPHHPGDRWVFLQLPATLWVSGDSPDEYALKARVEWVRGDDGSLDRVAVTRLELRADEGVTAESLRSISIPSLLDEVLSDPRVARAIEVVAVTDDGEVAKTRYVDAPPDPALLAEAKRRSRASVGTPKDRSDLERVAGTYRDAAPGDRIGAVQRLGYSKSHAKRLVREAREAGLLEHSSRSKRD